MNKRLIEHLMDLPICERPYKEIAVKLGITEERLLTEIKKYMERGIIRKIRAVPNFSSLGFTAAVLVAWRVPEDRVKKVGRIMSSFERVTHCYEREVRSNWPYNLYTMIHGRNRWECREIVNKIAKEAAINDYVLLYTSKEFKKERLTL
jgi:DNA-binding Lrp family transcriptional regulator